MTKTSQRTTASDIPTGALLQSTQQNMLRTTCWCITQIVKLKWSA